MCCKTCVSENQRDFPAELTICFDSLQSTLKNIAPIACRTMRHHQATTTCLVLGYNLKPRKSFL
jgi:hypothetical protein